MFYREERAHLHCHAPHRDLAEQPRPLRWQDAVTYNGKLLCESRAPVFAASRYCSREAHHRPARGLARPGKESAGVQLDIERGAISYTPRRVFG
jgi:hypothetical protein